MDIVTLGAALNGSAEYVNSHFKGGSNIQIVNNPDGTQTINASGEVSSEDTVARADIAAIKDGETLDSFGDVETALATKANTATTYTKTEVDTALSAKANSADVYSKSDIDTAMSAKADKSTTYTKTEVDTALANKADITDIPTVPITAIQKNSTGITPVSGTVNITVPTTAADVSALPDTTKYATALSLTINSSTFVMTGQLKDQNGDNLGTAQTIDLPLESVVVGGSYDSQTQKVVLTLQNGNTVDFSVADLVSGLQTEITSANKLDADLVDDSTSTNKFVTAADKAAWNAKQNAIDSLHMLDADLVDDTTSTHKFATVAQLSQIETNKNNISKDEAALVEIVDSGAKNFIKNTAVSKTVNGVTFTSNSDGTIMVNGTASATTTYVIVPNAKAILIPDGEYVLSGCPSGGGLAAFDLRWYLYSPGKSAYDMGGSTSIIKNGNTTSSNISIVIRSGVTADNLIFKPMLCTATDYAISPEFVPYRPSYQELYDRILALENQQKE